MAHRWRLRPHQLGAAGEDAQQTSPEASSQRDFAGELSRLEDQTRTLRAQMLATLESWLDAAAPWAVEFWERCIAESVQDEPHAVIAMRPEARRSIKDEAAELMANARSHLALRMVEDRAAHWPHLKPQTDPRDRAFRRDGARGPFDVIPARRTGGQDSPPELVAGALNGVLGDIAAISARHGLELTGFNRGDPFTHRGEWHADRHHAPAWSQEMLASMAAYAGLHDRLVAALAEAERLEAARQQAEASRLWETA